jgi:hypothetical protein
MNKKIAIILSTFALIMCSNAFAANAKQERCSFPHHVTVKMPEGVRIMELYRSGPEGNLAVANIAGNSFDLVQMNLQSCEGGTFHLQVGTDKDNYAYVDVQDLYQSSDVGVVGGGWAGTSKIKPVKINVNLPNIEVIFENKQG